MLLFIVGDKDHPFGMLIDPSINHFQPGTSVHSRSNVAKPGEAMFPGQPISEKGKTFVIHMQDLDALLFTKLPDPPAQSGKRSQFKKINQVREPVVSFGRSKSRKPHDLTGNPLRTVAVLDGPPLSADHHWMELPPVQGCHEVIERPGGSPKAPLNIQV
jgi:hypothetical protein